MKINKIQRKIPIPEVHSRYIYPWPEMDVGDSVLIKACKRESLDKLKLKTAPSARYYGNKTGKKFKSLLDRPNNGVRIWRTE